MRIGVGLSPTFGNKAEYDENFIGRFSGYFAEIKQTNIHPSVAYRLNDNISLGFGINYARSKVEFRQMAPVAVATQRIAKLEGNDVTWAYWSSIKTITPTNATAEVPVAALGFNFRYTYRVGIGANYQLNDAWKLRIGTSYDKTPVPSAADRTMTLPDADRTWPSVGARYTLSPQSSLDMGYSHIFFKKVATERMVALGGPFTQTIRGNFDTSADLHSVQYNPSF